MRKGVSYTLIAVLIAAAILITYFLGGGPTGFAILGQYTTEADCVNASYVWENLTEQNCTDIPDCVMCADGCVLEEDFCETDCVTEYTETLCAEGCVTEGDVCETGCEETCQDCVDVVIGGQCTGDVCDSDNLSLCLDETNCTEVGGGYWYDGICNVGEEPSCSNDLALCLDETGCTGASGYWYDGICNVEAEKTSSEGESSVQIPLTKTELSAADIQTTIVNPGDSGEVKWVMGNTGTLSISACKVVALGDFSDWIVASEDTVNLNQGDEKEFIFDVVVPEETEEGQYLLSVSVECSEIDVSKDFTVDVVKKKLEFDLISADRTREDRVRVIYLMEELSGEDQDVELSFSLLDANNQEVAKASENRSIGADSSKEFSINIEINESLLPVNETTNETIESELTLVVNFNSQIYSSSVQEPVMIGAPIGGFAIFGEGGIGTGGIVVLVIVVLALVIALFVTRRMRKSGKTLKDLFKFKNQPQ